MTSSKKPRGLTIGIVRSQHSRKYLGDPSDPHFTPKSPLIDRQKLSEKDEAELKRMCTLALAEVPHSDDMTDDPFRYLAKHITTKQQQTGPKHDESRAAPVTATKPAVLAAEPGSSSESTAAPSEVSKRETLDTTPTTTPEVTPGETGKRFSDAGRRPSAAVRSQLRTEIKTFKGTAVYSFLKDPAPIGRPQTVSATKSLTHLPASSSTSGNKSRQMTAEVVGAKHQTKGAVIGRPDFNKSLPAIPKATTREDEPEPEQTRKEKSGAISRMLKTVRLQRTQPPPLIQPRSTSTDAPRQTERLLDASDLMPLKKQRRFNISHIFHKRGAAKRATVN